MVEQLQVYKCDICGNIIEVLNAGPGQLVCCGQPMILMTEKTKDQGMEKHLPVAEGTTQGVKVKVGSIPHPMQEEHYIQWIEVVESCGKVHRRYLKAGDVPEAVFHVCCDLDEVRSYCNLHGHWGSKDSNIEGSCDHCCG